jgi:hypothetical protein
MREADRDTVEQMETRTDDHPEAPTETRRSA